jgi:hypothetical protein
MSSGSPDPGFPGVGAHGVVDDLREVTLQTAARFGGALTFGSLSCEVGAGVGVPTGLHHGDGEQGPVELAVPAAVEPVARRLATGGG